MALEKPWTGTNPLGGPRFYSTTSYVKKRHSVLQTQAYLGGFNVGALVVVRCAIRTLSFRGCRILKIAWISRPSCERLSPVLVARLTSDCRIEQNMSARLRIEHTLDGSLMTYSFFVCMCRKLGRLSLVLSVLLRWDLPLSRID